MEGIEDEQQPDNLVLQERCEELSKIALQWKEQIVDLRNFSQIEKETLENEISTLQIADERNEYEKRCLENTLMTLEDERVTYFTSFS